MAKEKKPVRHTWQGRDIYDPKHAHDLEQTAALNEFQHGMPRKEAEQKAFDTYKLDHLFRNAAHHRAGYNIAQAIEYTPKRLAAMAQHDKGYRGALAGLKKLGEQLHPGQPNPYDFNPAGPIPPMVKQHMAAPTGANHYTYKPHPGDDHVQLWSGFTPTPDKPKT
jgi:hypothetical protein